MVVSIIIQGSCPIAITCIYSKLIMINIHKYITDFTP